MSERVSIQAKLRFLENQLDKHCLHHNRQAQYYCLKLNCSTCPFLCPQCVKEFVHPHNDQLYQFYQYIKRVCLMIQDLKKQQNQLLETDNQGIQWIIIEQTRILDNIEAMERNILSIFQQTKAKLIGSLNINQNKIIKKNNASFLRFYSNPNILVNKIVNDQSFDFINFLKHTLSQSLDQNIYNSDNFLRTVENDLKNKIRQVINGNGVGLFKKPAKKNIKIKSNFIKAVSINGKPLNMFNTAENLIIPTGNQTYCINTLDKSTVKFITKNIKQVARPNTLNDASFLALTSSNNFILFYNNFKNQNFSITGSISSIGYLTTYSKAYALLGLENGTLLIKNLHNNTVVFQNKCTQSPIVSIQIYTRNSSIICIYENSLIHIYKYQPQYQSIIFEYSRQLQLKFPDFLFSKLNQHQLVLFGKNKNICIFNLMVNCEILRTKFIAKSGNFLNASVLEMADQLVIVTATQGQKFLQAWITDRKGGITNDIVTIEGLNNKNCLKGVDISNGSLWAIAEEEQYIYLNSFEISQK